MLKYGHQNFCLWQIFLHGNLVTHFVIEDSHDTESRQAFTGMLSIPKCNTTQFGLKCIYKKCINSWNQLTSEINVIEKQKYVNKLRSPDMDLSKFSKGKLKETIKAHMLSKYDGWVIIIFLLRLASLPLALSRVKFKNKKSLQYYAQHDHFILLLIQHDTA